MVFPTPEFGDFQPLAHVMSRASDPGHTATVARELASPDHPIMSAPAGGSDGGAAGSLDELWKMMSTAAKGTDAEVKNGQAPMPPNVSVLPVKSKDNPLSDEDYARKALQDYEHLRDISSVADLFIAMLNVNKRTKRGHPEPYRITNPAEAAQAFADMADSAYTITVEQPLAGMFSFASGTSTSFSRRMSKTELHLSFLAEIFKGFDLTDVALKQLDGILTNFIKSLADISISTEETKQTVDQTIRLHQTIATNISGSAEHPVWIYQPRTRIVYMHIDTKTWKWATNKADHEESTFHMNYVVVDADLNVNKWLAAKPQLEAIFQKVTGTTFAEYAKFRFPTPVDANAK